ncbi:18749_t:CDS:2 [Gigaspora rosea]|nr:18749_t:CDS:2 [Gigaspora rosea]
MKFYFDVNTEFLTSDDARSFFIMQFLRPEHNAILIDNKVYFLGGWFYDGINGDHGYGSFANGTLFYLNVSIPFTIADISSMPWSDLSSLPGSTNRSGASACIDAHSNNRSIVNIGGYIDNEIYIFGGDIGDKHMHIFDASKLQWLSYDPPAWPIATQGYNAVLLNFSIILYIGGSFSLGDDDAACYQQIGQMKTTTSGQFPSGRCGHSSVFISPHNRILIFYGDQNASIISLEVCKLPCTFTWSIPTILNDGGPKKILKWHSSTLIGAYVLITFGYTYNFVDDRNSPTSNSIYLLDISDSSGYKWVSSYDPSTAIQAIQPTPINGCLQCPIPSGIIAGLVIGTFLGTLIIVGVSYFGWRRFRHSNVIKIPGNVLTLDE